MSNRLSYRITAAKGLRLGFHASAAAVTAGTLDYNPADPSEHHHKAVTLTALQTVELAGAGETVFGELLVVEPPDGQSTKVSVNLGPVLWLRYTGTAPTVGVAVVGAAGPEGDGYVAPAGAAPNGIGEVIEVDTVAGECAVLLRGIG